MFTLKSRALLLKGYLFRINESRIPKKINKGSDQGK